MNKYSSIKQMIIDETISKGDLPSYEYLTNLVKQNFPNSRWQKSHYDWYKSQIKTGKIDTGEPFKNGNESIDESIVDDNIIEFSVSIERDLHNYLISRINEIEEGLSIIDKGIEYGTHVGFIDILAKDLTDNYVVVELKAGKAKDAALGQILGYIGAISEAKDAKNVRGILVASDFDNRVIFAAKNLPNLKLIKYSLYFKFTSLP